MEFLNIIIPYINQDIFKSQNHYNMFIKHALHIYNHTVNNSAIKPVKELKNTFWEHTDIFL